MLNTKKFVPKLNQGTIKGHPLDREKDGKKGDLGS